MDFIYLPKVNFALSARHNRAMFTNFMGLLMIQQKISFAVKHLNILQRKRSTNLKLFLYSLKMIYSFNYYSFLKERSTHFNATVYNSIKIFLV